MKRQLLLIAVLCLTVPTLRAQNFMNGDFEINTGTAGTQYTNINNSMFNNLLPFCHAYAPTFMGMTGSLDLLWGPSNNWAAAFTGSRFVGIVPYPGDIFSMELDQQLVTGGQYRISFYQRNDGIAEPIDFGLSATNDQFGDLIAIAPVSVSAWGIWTSYSFDFVAPNNGRFISLRMQPQDGTGAWTMVDHFTIEPIPCEPVLDLGPDRSLCGGQTLLLEPQGTAFTTYTWSDQSTAPTLTVTQPGTYWVIGMRGNCSDSDTVIISAGEIPEVVFEADRTEGCAPLPVTFSYTGHVQPGYTYLWTMDDGTTHTGASATHVYTQQLCHHVSLSVTNAQGCTATRTLSQYVCVHPAPDAAFTYAPDPVFVNEPHVQFINTSTGHVTSEWYLGDGTTSSQQNPQHNYALGQGADYVVRLIAVSEWGCTDTAWDTVSVRFPFEVFVPNAFTPDGDTRNPVFMPIVAAPFDVQEYQLQIYDRWGSELFSASDILHGWDGCMNKQPVSAGIYIWKISTRDPYTHQQIVKTGHVTVVY